MKKIIIIIILLCSTIIITASSNQDKLISLEDKYLESANFINLNVDKLKELVNNKENFLVFINCNESIKSNDFEQELYDFMNNYQISFYKISYFDLKDTILEDKIKNYPALAIFSKGKLITTLNINDNNNDFNSWLKEHISLPEKNINNTNTNTNYYDIVTINVPDTSLEDIKYDTNKVNIYLFWGNGCPHCEEFLNFLEENEDYKDLYNLNTFEVWYNQDNYNLMNKFANSLDEDISSVPFIVIGTKTFVGFGETNKEEILNTIKEQHNNSYDLYFQKIKN